MPTLRSSRPGLAWARSRDSLWLLPALAVVAGAVLALFVVRVPTPDVDDGLLRTWLFAGGADGARGVLGAIAGGLITVTGTVFSVTIVALQLASSQFTPRLLRSFVADRVNQTVLAVFIGTFTYALLVLRTIRTAGAGGEAFVPHVGVTIALLLLLVSVGALIVFIDHTAKTIRASVLLHRETQRSLAQIAEMFPTDAGRPAAPRGAPVERPDAPPTLVVRAAEGGYLQAVDADALWRAGDGRPDGAGPLLVAMELHVGAFAFPGKPLAAVWGDAPDVAVVERAVRDAFVLGIERTPEQDVEFGFVEISDFAVKALSPGINDPTTAMHCIDRLTELLAARAACTDPAMLRESPDRRVRLLVRDTPFERAVGLAFDQIRHFGGSNPTIAKKLLESLGDLAPVVAPDARPVLAAQIAIVLDAARREIADAADRAAVERLGAQAHAAVDRAGAARAPAAAAAATAATAAAAG